jgi:serine/threonine-protein kinase TTK/MPS1
MVSPSASPRSAISQLPPTVATSPPATPSPPSDDSSVIEDLSFDYIFDDNGGYIRLSKGSSKSQNSPPTPSDASLHPDSQPSPPSRPSLSRSESAYLPAPSGVDKQAARSFQRVTSGPALALTPNQALAALSKSRSLSRRVASEEANREQDIPPSSRSRPPLDNHQNVHQEEKENISEAEEVAYHPPSKQRHSPPQLSRPTASSLRHSYQHHSSRTAYGSSSSSVNKPPIDGSQRASHVRQMHPGPSRAGRVVKTPSSSSILVAPKYSGSSSGIDRIAEQDGSEGEFAPNDHQQPPQAAGDETDTEDEPPVEPVPVPPHQGVPLANVGRQRSLMASTASSSSLVHSSINRPRRSASLSDALGE